MDRHAVFVDAGYLLAAGGQLCVGTPERGRIAFDYAELHKRLVTVSSTHSQLPILRTYWYDGAPAEGGIARPTTDQLEISALPNLKLRLGRINAFRQQKGVDSLIMRDVITLARERAVAVMYLVAGDEDLREGVMAAQDLGVQVVLVGVDGKRNNQSVLLVNECDAHIVLRDQDLAPYFRPRDQQVSPAAIIEAAAGDSEETARNVGVAYAEKWFASEGFERAVLAATEQPRVPRDIDAELMRIGSSQIPAARSDQGLRRAIRRGFFARLNELIAERTEGDRERAEPT